MEGVVAGALLAIFITVAVAVVVQTARVTEQVRQRSTANTLAWSWVERIRNTEFAHMDTLIEPPPGNRVDFSGMLDPDGAFQRVTTIDTQTNGLVVKHIRVEVWPMNPRDGSFPAHPETIETVIADIPLNEGAP